MLYTVSAVLSLPLLILVTEQEHQLDIALAEGHSVHLCLSALQSLQVGIDMSLDNLFSR